MTVCGQERHASGVRINVRAATVDDADFLAEMLVEAAFWRPDGPRGSLQQVLGEPQLAHYIAGWPRADDLGVVADIDDPVGAAWFRFFTADDPGYGFVEDGVPELTMGVRQPHRGQGIGEHLLSALLKAAGEAGVPAVSLSVEPDNYARRLYQRHGFEVVGTVDGSLTMLRRL